MIVSTGPFYALPGEPMTRRASTEIRRRVPAALARGAVAGALARAAVGAAGGSPGVVAWMVAGTLVGATAPARPGGPRGLRLIGGLAPALLVLGVDRLAGVAADLLRGFGAGPTAVPVALGAAAVAAVALTGGRARGTSAAGLAAAAAGVALSLLAPPWIGALAGGLALAALPPVRGAAAAGGGGPATVAAGAGLVLVAAAVTPMTDPSPAGLAAVALGALVGGAAVATRRGTGAGATPLVALLLVGAWAALAGAPDAVREVTLFGIGARPARARVVLLVVPVLVGAVLGGGLVAAGRETRRPALWAGAGLALGATPSGVDALGALGVGLGLLLALGTGRPLARLGGALAVGAWLLASWQGLTPDLAGLAVGHARVLRGGDAWETDLEIREQRIAAGVEVGPRGAGVVRAPVEWARSAGAVGRPERWDHHVELSGLVSTATGRAAEAERLAGHLAGLLTPDARRALVLGDVGGRALQGLLQHPVAGVRVATPVPATVRAVAGLDPAAREAWLSTRVGLVEAHPSVALRDAADLDLVLEIITAPWTDAARPAADARHLDAVRRAVGADGTYVAAVHLGWFGPGEAAALAAAIAARFGHLQVWLPPSGADTMVLVAGPSAPSLARLEAGFGPVERALRDLGVPTPGALAGFAVADGAAATAWGGARAQGPADRLGDGMFGKPILHLAGLAPHVAPPERLWDLDGAGQPLDELASRVRGRRTFLELLGDASRGDLEGVFSAAQRLVAEDGDLATQALEALIEPHLEQAREALTLALREGPASPRWEDAQRYATTARLLSPRSPAPPLILGEIALAQGNLNRAAEQFQAALALDEASLGGHNGLARVALARRDFDTAGTHFQAAASRNPQDWLPWAWVGNHLIELQRYPEAEEALKRSASLAGKDEPRPHLLLATLYLRWDRPTTALVHAERAAVVGGSAEAYYLRGQAYFAVGELDAAARDFRQAVQVDPKHALAQGALGHVLAEQGLLPEAVRAWRLALAIAPDNGEIRENLRRAESRLVQQGLEAPGAAP